MSDSTIDNETQLEPRPVTRVSDRISAVSAVTRPVPGMEDGFAYFPQFVLTAAPLLLGDLLALGVSVVWAYFVADLMSSDVAIKIGTFPILIAIVMLPTFMVFGLYPGAGLHPVAELRKTTLATTLLFFGLIAAAYIYPASPDTVAALVTTYISAMVLVPLCRAVARTLGSRCRWWGQRLIVCGDGETVRRLKHHYLSHPRLGFRPVQIIVNGIAVGDNGDQTPETVWWKGLKAIRDERHVFWAVLPAPMSGTSASIMGDYVKTFPRVLVVLDCDHSLSTQDQAFDCAGLSAVLMTNRLLLPFPRLVKRLMDYFLAIAVGLFCVPLIVLIWILVKVSSPGPAFYSQQRIGKLNRTFWTWKFRTMCVDADEVFQKHLDSDPRLREEWARDHKLKKDPRVTTIGHLLRKTSLDELPQLWNIFRGEMSLVGPRPIVADEISKYRDSFEIYTRATPGITGLWQISGRNNTTYDERVQLDTYYVLNWSPWLDLYILARTIKVVLLREGAY